MLMCVLLCAGNMPPSREEEDLWRYSPQFVCQMRKYSFLRTGTWVSDSHKCQGVITLAVGLLTQLCVWSV